MATRQHRLSEFDQGLPPSNRPLELLCEDHSGTYLLPYHCHWIDGVWRNSVVGKVIEGKVIGWRVAPPTTRLSGRTYSHAPWRLFGFWDFVSRSGCKSLARSCAPMRGAYVENCRS